MERLCIELGKELLKGSYTIVDGHYRTINGKRIYVRPYLRKR